MSCLSCSAVDNPEYYHMEGQTPADPPATRPPPPPKPPRTGGGPPQSPPAPPAESQFSGEYLYTRLERPPVPPPARRSPPRLVAKPPPAQPRPSPYDNVPMPLPRQQRAARASPPPAEQAPPPPPPAENGRTSSSPEEPQQQRQSSPPERTLLTEEELRLRHQLAMEERVRAEARHEMEQSRLDEILNMCAEYAEQSHISNTSASSPYQPVPPPTAPRPPGSPAPNHIRIKTNGSLPRDRRMGSPGPLTPTSPQPADLRRPSLSDDEPGGGAPSEPAPPPPLGLRSPYENVHYPPQSPRTRIRTTLQREASPPVPAGSGSVPGPGVYQVPPRPVPVPVPVHLSTLQFENKEYMRGLTEDSQDLDESFQQDDHIFMPAAGMLDASGGYVNASMDDETRRAAADLDSRADQLRRNWRHQQHDSGDFGALNQSFSELAAEEDRETCRRLKEQRRLTYRLLSELRQQKLDLEHQESEAIRQLEMEYALLEGEVQSCTDRLVELDGELGQRRLELGERTEVIEETRERRQTEVDQLAARITTAEAELERLEELSDKFRGTTDEETALLEKLKYQHELVEQERKAHEDKEFRHMEAEVNWEHEREESLRAIADLEHRIANTRSEMSSIRDQQRSLIEAIRRDAEAMEEQRREIVKQMCQEREKLRKTQRRLSSLSQSGVEEAADNPDLEEPELSSDTELTSNEYIESRLAQLHMLGKSRDDLQRIQNVAANAPMQMDNRSSNTLREIERNRHLLLAKQGTQVIEDERRRVEELKRRVQDEVTAQWEERKRREVNCSSLTSVGSDEAPHPASNGRPGNDQQQQLSPVSPAANNVWTNGHGQERDEGETDEGEEPPPSPAPGEPQSPISDGEEPEPRPRPVSDASSVFEGMEEPVRRRNRLPASPQQRPLTRYLPIRDDSFDLKQHIETAGHQLEVCPHVIITRHTCRGYLHKMSSRFRSWQKRWFVFDRNKNKRTFMYFADKSETKAKGGVYFQAIEEVYVDHLKSGRNTTFCMKTMSRTFHLMAPSPETMRIWVDVIMTGAEGYLAFGEG